MNQENLPQKVVGDLSRDDLSEIKRDSDEIVKNSSQEESVNNFFCEVASLLTDKFGAGVTPDSLSDSAMTNYFYLLASSKDYEKFLRIFDERVPIDYESVLFKAIELEDCKTIMQLLKKTPDLLNIKFTTTFSKKSMKDFLIQKGWGEEFEQFILSLKLENNHEPKVTIENPCFEEIKGCVEEKARRRVA